MNGPTRLRPQHGWTIWETIVGISLLALALLAFTDVFNVSDRLATETRSRHRAEESLRRNLEAVANALRDVDAKTLDGFDGYGVSGNPVFARVTNVDEVGPVYGGLEELRWTSSPHPVPGVMAPGDVVHVRSGVARLIADRVPQGGFSVTQEGGTLVVRVHTYYSVDGHLEWAHGSTAIALRN
jgi:hypothetical protein